MDKQTNSVRKYPQKIRSITMWGTTKPWRYHPTPWICGFKGKGWDGNGKGSTDGSTPYISCPNVAQLLVSRRAEEI